MSKPMIRVHDLETDQIIDREMTEEEFAQLQIDEANSQKRQAEIEAKANAKIALLERLGITEDEAKLLLA